MQLTQQQEEQLKVTVKNWFEGQGISPCGWVVNVIFVSPPLEVNVGSAKKLIEDRKEDGRSRAVRATTIELSEQDWQIILTMPWRDEVLGKLKMLKFRGNDGFVPSDFQGLDIDINNFTKHISDTFRKAGMNYRCTCALGGNCWKGPFKIRICK